MKTTERKALRPAVRLMIAASNGYDCVLCGHRLGAQFHIDHRVALCNGGEDGLDNLQDRGGQPDLLGQARGTTKRGVAVFQSICLPRSKWAQVQ
jgi:hypothetical protein